MNVNMCLGRRAGGAPDNGEQQRGAAGQRSAPAAQAYEDRLQWALEEGEAPVPDFVDRAARGEGRAEGGARFSWRDELAEPHLSRSAARAGERARPAATRPHRTQHAGERPGFDPRVVGEACRAVLRNGQGSSDSGAGTPEWNPDDDSGDSGRGGARRAAAALSAGRPAEPWWRAQISQQMDHARLESGERHRRQRIATVLADNEQHRRVAQQQAYEMEDEQERVRRRAFAKIVLEEEQHARVCEDHGADMRDMAERNRRRRWAVKALREEEARRTMVRALHPLIALSLVPRWRWGRSAQACACCLRMLTRASGCSRARVCAPRGGGAQERLELRAIEQGRADPHTPYARALVHGACVQQSVARRNRALMLAGLKLHVLYLRAQVSLGMGIRSSSSMSYSC